MKKGLFFIAAVCLILAFYISSALTFVGDNDNIPVSSYSNYASSMPGIFGAGNPIINKNINVNVTLSELNKTLTKDEIFQNLFGDLGDYENESEGIIIEFRNKQPIFLAKKENPSISIQDYEMGIFSEHNNFLSEFDSLIKGSSISSSVESNLVNREFSGIVNALALKLTISQLKNMSEGELAEFSQLLKNYNIVLEPNMKVKAMLSDSV